MPGELVLRYCSPTLAGMKTGNIFTYQYQNENNLIVELNKWNELLNCKGIYFVALRKKEGRALIYVYRRTDLERELSKSEIIAFLTEKGYLFECVEDCIDFLSKKLQEISEFPHEIGVFLGYPLEDIKAFIENKGANCKCVGCWKAYTNECVAQKIFEKYKKCEKIYCKKHAEGYDITRLTVAV